MEAWPQLLILLLHGGMAANFWFFFSMEAWPQLLILLLLHGGMAANFQSSRNLTKTSQNFQSYTLPNFLRKLLKTSYENFSKLPILHSSNPLAILRKLLTKTSNSSTFGYENLKLPILSQTSISSNLKTWKISTFGYETSQTSQNFLRKLLTKTSQNFQSYTLPILSQSSNQFLVSWFFFNGWKFWGNSLYFGNIDNFFSKIRLYLNEILIFSNFPAKSYFVQPSTDCLVKGSPGEMTL